MKKIIMSMFVLGLAGYLYAGEACCSAKKEKSTEKTEKKACTECSKTEGKCEKCTAKAEVKKEVKAED